MPCYQDLTDKNKIRKEIASNLQDEEMADEALQLIANLCWEAEITDDPMSQWLRLLKEHGLRAQKWKSSEDRVEIYPSGTHGKGKSDRLLFQVGATSVAVIKAYESDH